MTSTEVGPCRKAYSFVVSLCFFDSAAVEAELARQKVHLRGPEELQQATRFLHDNGTENITINSKHTGFITR